MKTDQTDERIALQPESEIEQALLAELFSRLTAISDAPDHPDKVGDQLVFYTLDVPEYDGLDADRWAAADLTVDDHGRLDPEPGSRALVVVHAGTETLEEPDEQAEDVSDADADEDAADDQPAPGPKKQIDEVHEETVPSNAEVDAAHDVIKSMPLDDAEYATLQSLAKQVTNSAGADIPANQSTVDLVADLQTFVDEINVPDPDPDPDPDAGAA